MCEVDGIAKETRGHEHRGTRSGALEQIRSEFQVSSESVVDGEKDRAFGDLSSDERSMSLCQGQTSIAPSAETTSSAACADRGRYSNSVFLACRCRRSSSLISATACEPVSSPPVAMNFRSNVSFR